MSSKGVNKVILVGNLGRDPEVRYMPNGGAVANLAVATSDSWKDKNTGEQRERTEWHRVAIFGKLAEIAGEYLRKGSQVYLEGKLQTRKWQDQQGQDRYTTEIVLQGFDGVMQMLGSSNNSNPQGGSAPWNNNQAGGFNNQQPQGGFNQQPQGGANQAPQGNSRPAPNAPQQAAPQQPTYNEPPMDFDDDIPF